ncbi:unnamed protein product [Rhizophagus irregularis]|nr:unnamed protein product [Rhizophagus irregularis]
MSWGYPALAEKPDRRKKPSNIYPVERFKLHLGDMENKPYLPEGLDFKTAITDYLREMAEFDSQAMKIMRKCAYDAGIINEGSENLEFTTEPEAAAVYCMKKKEYHIGVGSSFMIVDCGGGTVDLTTHASKPQFTGQESHAQTHEFDLSKLCPVLKQCVKGEKYDEMEEMGMDIGGFSESKYLQARIKKEFGHKVPNISVPIQPVTAVVRGAVQFGLEKEIIKTRVLKWTYGTDVAKKWGQGDPIKRKRSDGRVEIEAIAQAKTGEKYENTFDLDM